jgi:hypothetical protein
MNGMQPEYASELLDVTEKTAAELLDLSPAVAAQRPAPGKWSIKEIVGHLIDSASNNHQRFVRAQWTDDLVFSGYDQDAWVVSQGYQGAPWPNLVVLWREFNRQLARMMTLIPETDRTRRRLKHNLDQIGFRTVSADQPVTLDYFMRDYVEHLKHHVRQIAALRGHSA